MPNYEDPGAFCKCCCPICAVYQAQGTTVPVNLLFATVNCCLCWPLSCFTLCMWDPTAGNPNQSNTTVVPAGAPSDIEMAR